MIKKDQIQEVTQSLDNLNVYYLQYIRENNGFFSYEIINSDFYKIGKSKYLEKGEHYHNLIHKELNKLITYKMISSFNLDSTLFQINNKFEKGIYLYREIVRLVKIRGFKDFGIEGTMRENVHRLENMPEINQISLLSLRRHEKDYIIRMDTIYVQKLKNVALEMKEQIITSHINKQRSQEALKNLNNYVNQFEMLVEVDHLLGLKKHIGLKERLDINEKELSELFVKAILEARTTQNELLHKMQVLLIFVSIIITIIGFFVSWLISRQITKPIVMLSSYIDRFVTNKFINDEDFLLLPTEDETGKLIVNFEILKKEILAYINDLNQKVIERTAEVSEQKSLIERQNRVIGQQNKNVMASIRYARHIQEAILPDVNYISSVLPEYGLFYQPRDIVSGDFYFIDDFSDNKKDKVFIAVADCTGHGVPGAFMSLIGHNALHQAVKVKKMSDPVAILQHLDKSIHSTLHEKNRYSKINDGMDIGICVWDRKTNYIEFSGSNISLYIIRNNTLIEYSGQKYLIGHVFSEENIPNRTLTKRKIQVFEGDIICMSTDGYYDQFGGNDGRKMKRKRFKKLLESLNGLTVKKQNTEIVDFFENWRGKEEQVDDVLVLWFNVI
jgi:serine phosphatase RsbU (regulator of sigma subunit)